MVKGTDVAYRIDASNVVLSAVRKEVSAQPRFVSGKVLDAQGNPVVGAAVIVKGTTVGMSTGADGDYLLQISPSAGNAVLVVNYLGFRPVEVTVGNRTQIDFTLHEESQAVDAVVVTALGIKRSEKALSYNAQQVSSEDISIVKDVNLMNSLNGKIAGAVINSSASGIGGATRVVLRGLKSIISSNNALYVVDGIPLFNNNNGEIKSEFESQPRGEGLTDLNPDDIESMTVLTGPSAAALYGSSAANGVIVITTKGAAKPAADEAVFNEKPGSVKIASASTEDMPFLIVEKMPSFRGGDLNDFRAWVQEHLQYPAEAVERNIQGRVVVTFTIEKEGSVSNILVLQSPDKLLADEARRVIASSPAGAWTPGEQRGEKVRVKYTLPVDFRLPQTESATVQGAPDGNEPFLVTEKMPSFRSGEIKDFRNWIQMHIQYPAEAMKNNIQGRVIVSFIVEKDGSVSNILVLQSPDKLLADEALRVIASSPAGAWTPGEQRGEKVRVKYTLPVDFYLQGSGDKLSERPEKPQGSLDGILVVGYGATSK